MSEYNPTRWAILSFDMDDGTKLYKIIGSWYGGYTGGDSWKISSGITNVDVLEDHFSVTNHSGSIYKFGKTGYGMSNYTASVVYSYLTKMNEGATAKHNAHILEEVTALDLLNNWK